MTTSPNLEEARQLCAAADALVARALERARDITDGGRGIDDHQVLAQRVAYAATEARAARDTLDAIVTARGEGSATEMLETTAVAAVAGLTASLRQRLEPALEDLGLDEAALEEAFPAETRALLRRAGRESVLRAIGRHVAETRGRNEWPLDEISQQVRAAVRDFADKEVAPEAERIHRNDELVPERFITSMAELGYFGLAIPEAYGGSELGNLAMILSTEELSRASLAAAGSLITRPEILTKALIQGGTEAQKQHWLPRIASGELMVGIAVTEPDIGSDVASLKCRAEKRGDTWILNGPKSWCTFAGRANVLAVLLRTDPDVAKGAKGLSLFIVPKDAFDGHDFEMKQEAGGRLVGKADATPGYRGMHSFTLNFENFAVPAENLVGGEAGLGRGFYLQMAGFAAGRLQTGGRACGLAQAALEKTAEYVVDRIQFGRPISEFQLTQFTLGRMAALLAGARAITYAAAVAMDEDERAAAPLAAQAKLLACDVAVEITQLGQLMHGGWGYAEEYPISRYVVDAQVLPIFEGVKPILELKVVARSLLAR
ncbi:MAG: acyl-CoA dehydrogenase family protein [Myxococcales bacterium]|nr:acyl-CoA dehydrogenase family protein [Myxococcales bacterium]MDH5307606.1 acyl-CoA dehydrogenase family protein [Myxococcales bacterium]MDH5567088.1 acyl-CoA dehydrogenase family protein [Myxococcales bacterium]